MIFFSNRYVYCVLFIFVFLFSIQLESLAADSTQLVRMSFSMFRDFSGGLSGAFEQFRSGEYQVNINNNSTSPKMIVRAFGSSSYKSSKTLFEETTQVVDNAVAVIEGIPLVYPNPFRQSSANCNDNGQNECARLVYDLQQAGDIEIQIYDMLANLILERQFLAGTMGAKVGQNQVLIDSETFVNTSTSDQYFLSTGVYFYLILSGDEVIGRGKMMVKP